MAAWDMWYTSLVLFATVTHKVSSNSLEMDLAPDAVDDAYSACREQMLQTILAKDGILQTELNNDSGFKSAWDASKDCNKLIPGGQQEHTQALQSFANSRNLIKKVNEAVKTKGGNVDIYTNQFQFKSLHFLLMDAMRLLNGTECHTVFSSTFDGITAVKGNNVRFGTFLSAIIDRSEAEEGCADDGGTLFNITTCSLINVEKNVCVSEETTLLISPVELFKVVDVKKKGTDCGREIVLTTLGFKSDHDCYLFPRVATTPPTAHTTSTVSPTAGSSTQWMTSHGIVLLTTLLSMCSIFLAL